MPDGVKVTRAGLIELEDDMVTVKSGGKDIPVQFNPESLKVSFSNQVQTPDAQGNKDKPAPPRQVFGSGTTKLTLSLWFDVNAPDEDTARASLEDVREITKDVAYFMKPQERSYGLVPPFVRFLWGTFQYDGIMEALDESLEYFSPEGRPLRASMSVTLSQTKIDDYKFGTAGDRAAGGGPGGKGAGSAVPQTPGTAPLAQASAGMSFQAMADLNGAGANWQAAASANGIENPRSLEPGQFVSFNAQASGGASLSAGFGGSVSGGQGITKSVSFNKSF